jgi:hypothetical protein
MKDIAELNKETANFPTSNTKAMHSCTKTKKPMDNNGYGYWDVSSHLNPLRGFRI